jgi:hypothetical protein
MAIYYLKKLFFICQEEVEIPDEVLPGQFVAFLAPFAPPIAQRQYLSITSRIP